MNMIAKTSILRPDLKSANHPKGMGLVVVPHQKLETRDAIERLIVEIIERRKKFGIVLVERENISFDFKQISNPTVIPPVCFLEHIT